MRRQLAERAQLAGLRLAPVIEVEYLGSALDLVSAGFGDTVAPRAALAADGRTSQLHATPLAEPLYDTVALIRRHGHPLSPATTEFARLAHDALLENLRLPGSTAELVHEPAAITPFLR
jgi:DNA-binding transcriptional LysR family regulator